jgi:hypothetical protein
MKIDHGAMQGLVELLDRTFKDLKIPISLDRIEQLAITVHNAMSAHSRYYHNLEHVFDFSDPTDPIVHIAALFHDIVYYQVDMGFSSEIEPVILPYVTVQNDEFTLAEKDRESDSQYHLVLAIFDLRPAQKIHTNAGLNEFLSALVMTKMLGDLLPARELVKALVCIEATIPFRGIDAQGRRHFEVLEERLTRISQDCGFTCSRSEIENILRRAVLFSNQDVQTFAEPNVARFLDITWKLLPEMNSALRSRGIYSVRDYRIAIQKMEGFLSNLNPDSVFGYYKDTPPAEVYEKMRLLAQHNITIASRYLRIKLISIGILEGIAEYSGGDAPISLFIGDIPYADTKTRRLDDFLPDVPVPATLGTEEIEIFQLLKIGRDSESPFDLRNSPLSLFVYLSLPKEQVDTLYEFSRKYFKNQISLSEYLASIPRHLLTSIAQACAMMAYTRRERLLQLVTP